MRIIFNKKWLQDLAEGKQRGKQGFNKEVVEQYRSIIAYISDARDTNDLRKIKSFHFERLRGDKLGLYSIRVTKKYRLEFMITKGGDIIIEEIIIIENLSNHYK